MVEMAFPPGVSRGATEADRPGRWYDSNLIRWRDGRLMPLGGTDRISPTASTSPTRRIFAARDNTDIPRIFLGRDNGVIVLEGSTFTDITPAGFIGVEGSGVANGFGIGPYGAEAYGTPRSQGDAIYSRGNAWSMDSFGQDVLISSASDGRLLRWSAAAPATACTVVANSPPNIRGMVVTAERHVVAIAGRRVMWSDRENATGWDFDDIDTQSGFIDLLDTPSMLVALVKTRDGALIFSEATVDLLQYVGAPLYYGTQRVGTGTTLMSPQLIATFGSSAMWLGVNGFWSYDSGTCSVMPSEVSAAIFSDDPVYGHDPLYSKLYGFASHHGNFQEVWFHYCSKGSAVPNRIAVYNYGENWWALHNSIRRTAMCPSGVYPTPCAAGVDGHLYNIDVASHYTDAGISRIGQVYVESNALRPGGQAVVLRGEMDSGTGNPLATRITVKARATREGPSVSFGPYTPGLDGRTPMRAGGADLRLRIEAAIDNTFSIGRMVFDVAPVGNR